MPLVGRQGVAPVADPGEGPEVGDVQGVVNVAGDRPRSGQYGWVQWRLSVSTHAAGDAGTGGFHVLDMVSGGGSAEGRASKVRTGIVARTVAAGY